MKYTCHFLFNHLGLSTLQNSTQFSNSNSLVPLAESQSYVTTDGQSASLSWWPAPSSLVVYFCVTQQRVVVRPTENTAPIFACSLESLYGVVA
jgi:hypothetical protein